MQPRHGWLFPVMVLAALSVIVFGVLGISAITGQVPLAPPATYSPTPAVVSNETGGGAKVPPLVQAAVPAETAQPPQGTKRLAQHHEVDSAAGSGTLRN
jgi:hypothetical protein